MISSSYKYFGFIRGIFPRPDYLWKSELLARVISEDNSHNLAKMTLEFYSKVEFYGLPRHLYTSQNHNYSSACSSSYPAIVLFIQQANLDTSTYTPGASVRPHSSPHEVMPTKT